MFYLTLIPTMVDRIVTGLMNTNTYLFSHWKKGCIIIDPAGNVDEIISHIEIKNFTPLAIICTHGHFDHIAAIAQLRDYFQPKDVELPIYIHSFDSNYFGENGREQHLQDLSQLGAEFHPLFHSFLENLPEADILLEEGQLILDTDLQVIHTPGHTPGGISIYSESDLILSSRGIHCFLKELAVPIFPEATPTSFEAVSWINCLPCPTKPVYFQVMVLSQPSNEKRITTHFFNFTHLS
ncbi:MAG: MBL fold metallo-hydrolase [Spirochaetia bacterium]|nr:MBL fold metallo-hydrolase [Spirochaetia bacterium]